MSALLRLSYRDIAYVLKYVKVSHEAVRKWVKRLSKLIAPPEGQGMCSPG